MQEDIEPDPESKVADKTSKNIEDRLDEGFTEDENQKENKMRILVSIKMSNVFQIHMSNIDHPDSVVKFECDHSQVHSKIIDRIIT